jgi:hypothetical protein
MVLITFNGTEYDTDTTYHLVCKHTNIYQIPSVFVNLITLDCKNTDISEIPSTLIHLEQIDCSITYVSKIPSTFVNLTTLICFKTNVVEIPDTLINLTYLKCSNTDVTIIPDTFVNLEKLYCDGTILSEIPSTLKNLIDLWCGNNINISELPNTLINLKQLSISKTNIENLPSSFTKLELLNCNYDQIKNIPSSFTNLEILECRATMIKEIPNTLVNLKQLNCRDTMIEEIPNTLINLKYLICSDSYIECIPVEIKNNLRYVDINNLKICSGLELKQRPYKAIKKVSKNKSSKKSKQLTDEFAQGFQTSKGCYTEKEGVVCNMIDLEDTENHEYLSQDDDNIIFMISPNKDGRYFAYGYNKKELIHDINTDVFYDCKRNLDGTYETSEDGFFGRYNKEGKAYVKINLNNYSVLVSSEELLAVIEDETKKVFLLADPTENFLYIASHGVMFGGQDIVSADHCQKGTNKIVYTLYILE